MKKEHIGLIVGALLIFGYVLDAVAHPLPPAFPTPYHFFTPASLALYPFTVTAIVLKALGLCLGVVWVLSFTPLSKILKGITLLVVSALAQFYSLQDIASGSYVVPLEWSLSLTLGGILLLIPMVLYFLMGLLGGFFTSSDPYTEL